MQKKMTHWLELFRALNVLLMTAPFAMAWYFYYDSRIVSPFYNKGNWLVIALFAFFYVLLGRVYDAFSISRNRISGMVYGQSLSVLLANFFMYFVIVLLAKRFVNVLPLFGAMLFQTLLSTIWAISVQRWYYRVFPPSITAVIYDQRPDLDRLISDSWMKRKYDVRVAMHVDESLEDLDIALQGIQSLFLSGIHSHDRNIIIKHCIEHGIEVFVLPRIGDVLMSGARPLNLLHLPMLRVARYDPPHYYLFLKRAFDIVASLLGLVVLAPVFILTAIAIKIHDGGPVLYRQRRLTLNGKEFDVLKFRSMRVDAEKDGVAMLSTGDKDTRITAVGRVIRKCRVDELPQLINILVGDMTICGPRPERPEIAAVYERELPEFRLRLQAKAGLTGYAQVYGKYNSTPYDKLQMDLMYIANPSLLMDLRIMLATVKILFEKESTEGFEEQVVSVGEQ